MLGMAAAPANRDLALQLYQLLKKLGCGDSPEEQAYYHFQRLRLAGRLNNGEAAQLYDVAWNDVQQTKAQNWQGYYGFLAEAAATSNMELADKALAEQTKDTLRAGTIDRMLIELADTDPTAALALLEKKLSDKSIGHRFSPELFAAVKTLAKTRSKESDSLIEQGSRALFEIPAAALHRFSPAGGGGAQRL